MLFWLSAVVCSAVTVLSTGAYVWQVVICQAVDAAKQKPDIPYGN